MYEEAPGLRLGPRDVASNIWLALLGGASDAKWKVKDGLYPCDLSSDTKALLKGAVDGAAKAWGERSLSAFEAEDRLSFACEKAPTEDAAIVALRAAFLAVEAEFKAGAVTRPLLSST